LYGGAILNATISLYAYTTVRPSADGQIHFVALDQNIRQSFPLSAHLDEACGLELHRGVYNRVVRDFSDGKPLPVTIETFCDAPAGSGLGSSSTLVVSMLCTLAEMLSFPLGEYDLAKIAYEIERIDVQLQGGRQDQYAAAFGGFNFMEFDNSSHPLVNPLRVKQWIISELESSLVLFFTGKSRSSAAIIQEESRNVHTGNEDAINAMHATKRHAFEMKDALLRGQIRTLAEVMQAGWIEKKRHAQSISNERLDFLFDLAMTNGAYCGKISGAGGGGFMMFLADPSRRLKLIRALKESGEGNVMECSFTTMGAHAWKVS
jgi:D-glycero-alpha-D-manno-heptose-7-phosphate kinase